MSFQIPSFEIKSLRPKLFKCIPLAAFLAGIIALAGFTAEANAQQTLGGITGTVTDTANSVISDATVTAVGEQTSLTRVLKSSDTGSYSFVNLPIGTYTLTFTHEGFDTQKFPGILVQADRTATLNAQMNVGSVNTSVTVEASPLMNAVDTTNGYVLDKAQIEAIPLPTGSPLELATLSPGVDAELQGGTGVNSGLGNPPIWANGQRDTSNSFLLNGVDASNLFNGKSTSQVASARIVNNTGIGPTNGAGGIIQSSASIYLSIGNALPSPAPESIQEIRVNASMYDAQQGSTSGAHIDMSTASGTNAYHGSAYLHRGTDWLNAAPFFFNQDPDVPANQKVPQLHRYVLGGVFGGPIIKDKLFGFISYQHLHVSDQEIGASFFDVPVGLSDDRSAAGLATLSNNAFFTNIDSSNINDVALALFNTPAAPGEPGKWLIPNATSHIPTFYQPDNVYLPGTARFTADQAVADIDWNANDKDTLAFKYYYQHDPTVAPYAFSSVPGFTQHLDAGSQVFSINNTYLLKSNLSTTQTVGFLREKLYSTNDQLFGPGKIPGDPANGAPSASINTFGSSYFPGVTIVDALGSFHPSGLPLATLDIGPGAGGQGSNTGVFQNRLMPSANAIWTLGRHSVTFGGSYAYTQLNTRDRRTGQGIVATADFGQFAQGLVTTNDDFQTSTFLQGNANRYYRANQVGMYLQDKFQATPTLSLTAGLRYDWNGGLTEKNGNLFNFDPSLYKYSYNPGETPGNIGTVNNGFVVAANNPHGGTPGASKTTLTGRQWGLGPRLGAAWQPRMFDSKVVIRGGAGMYYDRGELFTYFSPGYADGEVTGGPFGVNQAPPAVYAQTCIGPTATAYEFFIPTCDPAVGNLDNPFGTSYVTGPTTTTQPKTKPSDIVTNYLPNGNQILTTSNYLMGYNSGAISQLSVQPFSMGNYGRDNKLPYTMNFTLDVQWQPRNDLAIELGYVGNLGRHQIIPVPFNQPGIASPSHPINGQTYTYGYTVLDPNAFTPINLPDGTPFLSTYEGGNVDLRVPYIGYSAESETYKAAGVSSYHALQAHVEKRMSRGLQVGVSYTYSHALDEQSAMGLFYNGNNPLNLRGGYASSDFDRTHVLNFLYSYKFPKPFGESTLMGKVLNDWSLNGTTVIQSGQPYSIIDYTGAVGSIYYSTFDGITNPIVPLAPGCTPKNARTGASGAWVPSGGNAALKANCFTLPLLNPGDLGGAIPAGDTYETTFTNGQRNIFRQAYQKRADISLLKAVQFHERYGVKFSFDVFNLTNTTSFDVPIDDVSQNQYYNNEPFQLGPGNVSYQATLPTGCASDGSQTNSSFYNCPSRLGIVNRAIGSPRQIQMSLGVSF
ncbi:MAG TPA: carboxypeptidase regulatory-like domain-containing protein [Acidisarcina sp.]